METTSSPILAAISTQFPTAVVEATDAYKLLTIQIEKSQILKVLSFLFNSHGFTFLTDLCGVHLPESSMPYSVVYHLHNLEKNERLRIKIFSTDDIFPSVVPLFAAANWMERETYDFFGYQFQGHPDLRRILNEDSMSYFPMRKEYPLEDETRTDKVDEMFGR
jgi:NADH-quinone oxidoreductase subunit C